MKKLIVMVMITGTVASMIAFSPGDIQPGLAIDAADSLRALYSKDPSLWPAPDIDTGITWTELGELPPSPVDLKNEQVKKTVELGKILFYDPRLSGSNQISCISCHAPEMSWTDGRQVSLGHDQQANVRNAPTLENVWYLKHLFWDGRASSLEEQAEGPIGSAAEMHQDMKALPKKIAKIKGYEPLFAAAFGDKKVTGERIASAIATYERTLVSRKSDFDYFIQGDKKRLTDQQIIGLNLFRTKGRCMNCHNGPLFTDNSFHNAGLTYYGRDKYEDFGRYTITKDPADMGKFKTPGLRNVMRTRPWFHNGLFDNIDGVLNMYNAGMARPKPKPGQVNDPLFPKTDTLLHKLGLSKEERDAIVAFLGAITTEPWRIQPPELPQ